MSYRKCVQMILILVAAQGVLSSNHGLPAKRMHRHHHHHNSLPSKASNATITCCSSSRPVTTSHTTTQTSRLTRIMTTTSQPVSSSANTVDAVAISPVKTVKSWLTPNGIKAGIAGGDAYPFMKDHIGWWYDWSPKPSKPGRPVAVPMLWGVGTADSVDSARLTEFRRITAPPPFVLAYEEPDCPPGSGSAGVSVSAGVSHWESLIVPLGKKGTLMGSPSMCKQADETWLAEFRSKISTDWDFTAVHINKNNIAGVKKDIDHYWNKYRKPIWVTEFACVDDRNGFVPCTDQQEINTFINDIVRFLEGHEHVHAYAYSNGLGLGKVWPLNNGHSLSASGRTYLAAISKFH